MNFKDPAEQAAWVHGQPMAPCPKCGSYNMRPQMPIRLELTGNETAQQAVNKWARATETGASQLDGPCYYMCMDCLHKGPAVNCAGRNSEEARKDRALNSEMKRMWNEQEAHA